MIVLLTSVGVERVGFSSCFKETNEQRQEQRNVLY
jgi:hypothetical protein